MKAYNWIKKNWLLPAGTVLFLGGFGMMNQSHINYSQLERSKNLAKIAEIDSILKYINFENMNQCNNFSELEDSVHMLELERDSLECLVNFSGEKTRYEQKAKVVNDKNVLLLYGGLITSIFGLILGGAGFSLKSKK